MKPNKRLAAGLAAALVAGGFAAVSVSSTAQAATFNSTLYTHLGNTALQGPVSLGTQQIDLTVSPASAAVGTAIEVEVSSPTLAFNNGPAAATVANGARIDAWVNVPGVGEVLLAGPGNTLAAPILQEIIAPGWVVSSNAGESSGNQTNSNGTAPATTGDGWAILDTVTGEPGAYNATPLIAQFPIGTQTVTMRSLVNNSVATSDDISGAFDQNFSQLATGGSFGAGNLQTNAFLTQNFNVFGPEAVIVSSTGQNANTAAIRIPLPAVPTGYLDDPTVVGVTGTTFGAAALPGTVVAEFCDVSGTTCDPISSPGQYTITNDLEVDGSGNLTGSVSYDRANFGFGPQITTGNRSLKITSGSNVAITPILVLGSAVTNISPASGGPGTVVAVTGSNMNPGQVVNVGGYSDAPGTGTWVATADAPVAGPAAGANGNFGPINFTVNDTSTAFIGAFQGSGSGLENNASRNATAFEVNADRCVAYTGDVTGGPGCSTNQNVNIEVEAGQLTQRAYPSGTNPNATTIELGSITSPLAPTNVAGDMNEVTINDNRGGTNGWSLTAVLTDFVGVGGNTIDNGQLSITSACAPASNATAYGYNLTANDPAGTPIAGFDDTLNAPGVVAGGADDFDATVNLCTKDTTENATTQTTGGVYNVTAPVVLEVPAFQAADQYVAVMTITLA